MKFEDFLCESINDKGKLKAIFVCGVSGAGKSYTISQLKGEISPRVVNTDIAVEFIANKDGIKSTKENWRDVFSDRVKRITKERLFNYMNGMLPLFIDGTSSDLSNILNRIGILKSIGYDVGIVYVNVDKDRAIQRIKKRNDEINREVPTDFLERVFDRANDNKKYLKSEVPFFIEIENNDELTNQNIESIFNKVQGFYNEPLKNIVGKRALEKLQQDKQAYLIPTVLDKDDLDRKCSIWYKR